MPELHLEQVKLCSCVVTYLPIVGAFSKLLLATSRKFLIAVRLIYYVRATVNDWFDAPVPEEIDSDAENDTVGLFFPVYSRFQINLGNLTLFGPGYFGVGKDR